MTLDESEGMIPNAWVNISTYYASNIYDAVSGARREILMNNCSAFIGTAQNKEIIDVADGYKVPVCDGLDLSDVFDIFQPASGITLKNAYILDDSANITYCAYMALKLSQEKSDNVFMYLGMQDPTAACFLAMLPTMSNQNGFSWIVDSVTQSKLSSSNENLSGIIAVSIREGVGPDYETFLQNWTSPAYQAKYPSISLFANPPFGFMFYRTCLQLILQGFGAKVRSGEISAQQLSNGTFGGWSDSISVPASFSFPTLMTATGTVQFASGSGYRLGFYNLYFHNGTEFVLIGNISESLVVSIDGNHFSKLQGTGQQALSILQRLKRESKKTLTQVEIDIITDALTAGGNSAYNPQFESLSARSNIDAELQEFLMSYLAQSKRNTVNSETSAAPASLRNFSRERERSMLGAVSSRGFSMKRTIAEHERTSSETNSPNAVSEEEGQPRNSTSSWRKPSMMGFKGAAKKADVESTQRISEKISGSVNSSKDCLRDMKFPPKQANTLGSKRAGSVNLIENPKPSADSLMRRISAMAAPSHQTPKESHNIHVENVDLSMNSLLFAHTIDVNQKFEDFEVLLKPAKDIDGIHLTALFEYLNISYFTWNIDMFHVCKLSEGHPLYFSAIWVIEKTDILSKFNIEPAKFKQWLLRVNIELCPTTTPFMLLTFCKHFTSWHSTVIGVPNSRLLKNLQEYWLQSDMTLTIQFVLIFNNCFTEDPMAIMYSDSSVNEFHHSAHMFAKTLMSPFNIFSSFTNEHFEEIRRIIIKLILATDMGKHFEIMSIFSTKSQTPSFKNFDNQENRLMLLEIALKCADLNNPSRNHEISVQWSYCIMEEFYRQGDRERELGMPISNFMDRYNPNVAKCQENVDAHRKFSRATREVKKLLCRCKKRDAFNGKASYNSQFA
ncbi:High affinity cAMP-specific 3',5'-cyclic phosphodiesterase 7A [Entophlyctis luteolus]|nr:High affinity cAMP-specific 3',5'-cyclic phosphodiesterase 7A [Entophlyctis luteolus]